MIATISTPQSRRERAAAALRMANVVAEKSPNWETYFHAVLGAGGIVPRLFPMPEDVRQFADTDEYARIHALLDALKSADQTKAGDMTVTTELGVRIPNSMHASLKAEAEESGVSLNSLCLSKLIQAIDPEFIPALAGDQQPPKSTRQLNRMEACIPPKTRFYPFELQAKSKRALTNAIKRALYEGTEQPESTDLELVDNKGKRWLAEVEPYDAEFAYVMLEETTSAANA